jgi:3-oxoacyl-[acyl-carrier-protein] synthase II
MAGGPGARDVADAGSATGSRVAGGAADAARGWTGAARGWTDEQDVLVTGLGALSCLGSGVDAFWRGMQAARSAPRRVPDPLAHMDVPLMYLVPDADLPVGPAEQDGLPLGRASQYALVAAAEAVADAGLAPAGTGGGGGGRVGVVAGAEADTGLDPSRVAVAISSGMGDAHLHEGWRIGGLPGADCPDGRSADGAPADGCSTAPADGDRWAPEFAVASVVGGWFGAWGANTSISNACAASGYALSIAADLIRSGEADVVLAGGAEAYSRVALACFNRLGAVDPERCRPFAADRHGTVFGEGAAVLVLESAAHARRRGARRAYARLSGAGWSCDAYHATAPEPGGGQIERAMRQALAEAGVAVGDEAAEADAAKPGTATGADIGDAPGTVPPTEARPAPQTAPVPQTAPAPQTGTAPGTGARLKTGPNTGTGTTPKTAPGTGTEGRDCIGPVGFVVPHGTGTELNDVVESRVLASVLGEHAARTPLYSAKALLGHTGGAAAAFASLAAVLVLHHRTIPPNVPVGALDEDCPLLLPEEPTPVAAPYALVNAYAFGGNNVSLVFREAPEVLDGPCAHDAGQAQVLCVPAEVGR